MHLTLSAQVGMTGFEPATTRPPDAYSNRAELHPALFNGCKDRYFSIHAKLFCLFFTPDSKESNDPQCFCGDCYKKRRAAKPPSIYQLKQKIAYLISQTSPCMITSRNLRVGFLACTSSIC